MTEYSRHLPFEVILNFRDLGGYKTKDGRTIAWRRLFRSADFRNITENDLIRLKELGLKSVIDLRSSGERETRQNEFLNENGIQYFSIPFLSADKKRNSEEKKPDKIKNMGEFYLLLVKQKTFMKRLKEALKIIAKPENHPVVFHCAIGKDRTGVLAAIILSILGVEDSDIIQDYYLTSNFMKELNQRIDNDPHYSGLPKDLPSFFLKAAPESMVTFLSKLKQEYGSVNNYLKSHGIRGSLIKRLNDVLLL
jgi:protein-tyrosine phosphatase